MTREALNKGTLNRLRRQRALYQRVLPSLDMKRRQLIAERQRARRALDATDAEIRDGIDRAARVLPMLANRSIPLKGLVRVTDVDVVHRNLLGVTLPELASVDVDVHSYSYLSKPHWVDRAANALRILAELRIRRRVLAERLRLLQQAERKAVQRVNLLEKVLIPRTREKIRKVEIALADAERSAVVRSKIAKRRHGRGRGAPA